MKSDVQGCSTCPPGEERYEEFESAISGAKWIQYDYRTAEGKLFSCFAKSLQRARKKRAAWMINELTWK